MGDSHYKKRNEKAEILVNKVKEFLDKNNIPYIETGYEFLASRNDFTNLIKKLNDPISQFIRYYPDFCIYKEKSVFLECKNSSGIEKDCYDNYIKLFENLGIKIIICNGELGLCPVDKIKFRPLVEYDYRAEMNVPVIDGVWKNPRALPREQYMQYLKKYEYKTSGCTFAYVDFVNSEFEPIDNLKYYITTTPRTAPTNAVNKPINFNYTLDLNP